MSKKTEINLHVKAGSHADQSIDWQILVGRAMETFGSEKLAFDWLLRPSNALQNRTPLSVARTPKGIRQIERLLGRIDHGIAV